MPTYKIVFRQGSKTPSLLVDAAELDFTNPAVPGLLLSDDGWNVLVLGAAIPTDQVLYNVEPPSSRGRTIRAQE